MSSADSTSLSGTRAVTSNPSGSAPPRATDGGIRFEQEMRSAQAVQTESSTNTRSLLQSPELRALPREERLRLGREFEDFLGLDRASQGEALSQNTDTTNRSIVDLSYRAEGVPLGKARGGIISHLDGIESEYKALNQLVGQFYDGRQFSPAELIAWQTRLSGLTQQVEMLSKMVEHATSGTRTILQTNV